MLNLLKTDIKRAFRDKLFLICAIIGGALAIFTPLLYKVLFNGLGMEELLGSLTSAKALFFTSFSPANNFGLIAPILVTIILCKDFSYGTIRNKIISGKSRVSIFLSMFITSTIVMSVLMLAHALITLLVSLLFFDYQAEPFKASDIGYFALSVMLWLIVYVFISAIISFFSVAMKNAGVSVVMYFAVNLLFSIIGSITMVAGMMVDPESTSYKVLEFFNNANLFTSTLIGSGTSYEASQLLAILTPSVLGGALLVFLGIYAFGKKDLK